MATAAVTDGVRHRTVEVNGMRLHVAEAGSEDGAAVLLLHGFPDLWYGWRHQMTALAARGYRAVAPDLRGYGDSAAPPDASSYTTFHVVGDLVGLIADLGQPQVFVVGHDWGAIVAWQLCLLRPDLVRALVNLSVAYHPRGPERSPLQAIKALCGEDHYMCVFQTSSVVAGWRKTSMWWHLQELDGIHLDEGARKMTEERQENMAHN